MCTRRRAPQPIHFVAVYNITAGVTLPNSPYPPQPRYRCPDWKVINNGTFIEILPNEERLVNFRIPPVANYTWTATTTGTRWFVCPLGTHCRLVRLRWGARLFQGWEHWGCFQVVAGVAVLDASRQLCGCFTFDVVQGQVFKVVIRPRPTGRAPERREVTWTLTGSNYPDLTLYKVRAHCLWRALGAPGRRWGSAPRLIDGRERGHVLTCGLRVSAASAAQGDTLFFNILGVHALSVVKSMRTYEY